MWHLFQSVVIFAVIASNIHWRWTPNGYLAAMIGAGLAWVLTQIINELPRLLYGLRRRRFPTKPFYRPHEIGLKHNGAYPARSSQRSDGHDGFTAGSQSTRAGDR